MVGWSVGRARGSIGPLGTRLLAIPSELVGKLDLQGLLFGGLLLGGLLAACDSSTPASTSGLPTLSPPPSAPSGRTAAPTAPSATESAAGAVTIDRTLLEVLPRSIDGRPVEEASAAETSAASDPSLERLARGLAVGYVSSQSKEDWAIASVVALGSAPFGDAEFRTWRDTYETSVCASVGGPAGHAQATIGGRIVFIGSCGGLRIYHVLLGAPARLVAVTSAGAGDYGERLVAALRP